MFREVKPRAPRGTRKPRMPSGVEAHTTAISAIDPLVIHILVPDSSQSCPVSYTHLDVYKRQPWYRTPLPPYGSGGRNERILAAVCPIFSLSDPVRIRIVPFESPGISHLMPCGSGNAMG